MIHHPSISIYFEVVSVIEGSATDYVVQSDLVMEFFYWLHIAQPTEVSSVDDLFLVQPLSRRYLLEQIPPSIYGLLDGRVGIDLDGPFQDRLVVLPSSIYNRHSFLIALLAAIVILFYLTDPTRMRRNGNSHTAIFHHTRPNNMHITILRTK